MTTAGGKPRAGGASARARLVAAAVPAAIVAGIAGVLAWSSWPLVRPARAVTVVQAVFEGAAEAPGPSAASEGQRAERPAPTVQAPGWLEAEPYIVACTALADGVVESIEVLEGDFVERGALVARLVSEDAALRLRRAEAELASARAELAAATAEREAAETRWREPVELERAVAAQRAALAETQAELAQLPVLVESGRATLTRLEEEEQRVRRSVAQQAATAFELVVAEQEAAAQRAEVRALEARRPILAARVDRLHAELRAAERHLELRVDDRRQVDAAKAGVSAAQAKVAREQALRDEAALELERMTIRAPIDGYVQRRLKAPGDKVVRMMDAPYSAHLVHLYDPRRLQVRVDVPLADAAHVSVGQACEVVVEVLPGRVFRGEVLRTTHEADLQKNTLQVKVKVLDPEPILRPEMLTRVKFLPGDGAGDGEDAAAPDAARVRVPRAAIEGAGDRTRVWLVTQRRSGRGVLAARDVQTFGEAAGWVSIGGDVRPGDLLVVGLADPSDGERVVITADAAAEEGEAS